MVDFIGIPLRGLTLELRAFAIIYIIPEIFLDMNIIAFLSIAIGFGLWLFRWRTGKIELTDDKLIIDGSYYVSIWLKNMWEVDIRDMQYHRRRIMLDSNVDAVQIKFKTEREFEDFGEKLIHLVGQVENIRLKTTT